MGPNEQGLLGLFGAGGAWFGVFRRCGGGLFGCGGWVACGFCGGRRLWGGLGWGWGRGGGGVFGEVGVDEDAFEGVDGAFELAVAEGGEFEGGGFAGAVGGAPFADFEFVFGGEGGDDVGFDAVLVDGAVAGGVVFGGGEAHGGAGVEGHDGLHGAFAEAGGADDEGAFEVLQGAGDDLGGAGTAVIDEDGHGVTAGGFAGAFGGAIGGRIVGGDAAFGGDDEGAFREEFAADADGAVEQTAGVVAEVEDEGGHALFFEAVEGLTEVSDGGLGKLGDADVADAMAGGEFGVQEHGIVHGGFDEGFTNHFEFEKLLGAGAADGEAEGITGIAFEELNAFDDADGVGEDIIDADDLVAAEDTCAGGGSFGADGDDGEHTGA